MRCGLNAIQMPALAPGNDGGHIHVQSLRCDLGRTAAIPTFAACARRRPCWTTAANLLDVTNPLDPVRRERAAAAALPACRIERVGDLAVGMVLSQDADALDHCGRRATCITGTRWPRDRHRRTSLRLPAQGNPDGCGFFGQRDVLDQQTQQLLSLGWSRARGLPQRGQVLGQLQNALSLFGAQPLSGPRR